MKLLGSIHLLALLALSQSQGPTPAERPKEVLALVDQATALPPEFSADTLLKLAGSKLINDRRWKRELIEDAFTMAAHAQLPYLQHGEPSTDTRTNVEVRSNGLEALSLQTRAVEAMLLLDAPRALAMYRDIHLPDFPSVPCKEIIRADPSAYYATGAKLFAGAFSLKDRKDEEDVRFIEQSIRFLRSPVQVVPALKMMTEVLAGVTPSQRSQLVGAFASALDQVSGSDRVFWSTEGFLVSSAVALMHDSQLFIPSLRSYIVRQVTAPRCHESITPGQLSESVRQFNRLIAQLDPTTAQLRPITAEEAKPGNDEGKYEEHLFWQSARSKQVLEALRVLNFGDRNYRETYTLAERSTPEWNAHYLDTVKVIEGWKEEEEQNPEDYSFMVALVYDRFAELVPPGKARENAMDSFLQYLEQQYHTLENRNLWFSEVQILISTAHYSKDQQDKRWILDQLTRSSNPVIALYARLETLL